LTSEMTDIPIYLAHENYLPGGAFVVCSTYPQDKDIPWSTGWFLAGLVSLISFILLRTNRRRKR